MLSKDPTVLFATNTTHFQYPQIPDDTIEKLDCRRLHIGAIRARVCVEQSHILLIIELLSQIHQNPIFLGEEGA